MKLGRLNSAATLELVVPITYLPVAIVDIENAPIVNIYDQHGGLIDSFSIMEVRLCEKLTKLRETHSVSFKDTSEWNTFWSTFKEYL